MKTNTKVKVYRGQTDLRRGIRRWARKGYTVVGNVERDKPYPLARSRYTVTFQREA